MTQTKLPPENPGRFTTTSMGRLTLNMLLSFAQFERAVTAERIRDKIAASKAEGMWMGGNPPLGYRPDGRTLAIVPEHAELIRELFRRYLEIGNVRLLKEQLDADGIGNNTQGERRTTRVRAPSLLAGLVCDDHGEPLVTSHACKHVLSSAEGGKVRYRYYVSRALQHEPGASRSGIRLPGLELETAVSEGIAKSFDRPLELMAAAGLEPRPDQMDQMAADAQRKAERLRKRDRSLVRKSVSSVRVHADRIEIQLCASAVAAGLCVSRSAAAPDVIDISIDVHLRRTGMAMRLVQDNGRASTPEPQQHLIKLLQLARSWWKELSAGDITTAQLARRDGLNKSYVSQVVRLNFLAPEIIEAILAGTQPGRWMPGQCSACTICR